MGIARRRFWAMEFRSRFDNAFIIFLAAITVLILAV